MTPLALLFGLSGGFVICGAIIAYYIIKSIGN